MTTLSYHHTSRLTNPAAEKLGKILVGHRPGGLSHAIFLSSGSEANETAIKLVRQYYVEVGQPDRVHIISRNNSYHGNSIGCVSLTGIPVSLGVVTVVIKVIDRSCPEPQKTFRADPHEPHITRFALLSIPIQEGGRIRRVIFPATGR